MMILRSEIRKDRLSPEQVRKQSGLVEIGLNANLREKNVNDNTGFGGNATT
jgi:hypothetical protein